MHAGLEEMAAEIARVIGPGEAAGFRRYVDFVSKLYRYEMRDFIDRNIDSPLDLLSLNLARLAAIGGFRRLAPKVEQYLHDPRTQKLYSFQAMYAGLSPYDALALYAVIAYMDSVAGVFFPAGGMHAVPEAMAAAAEKHGVEIRYSTEVTRVEHSGGRAVAVHTAAGERIPADVVVLNPDLPVAYRELLGVEPRRLKRLRLLAVVLPAARRLHAGRTTRAPTTRSRSGTAWREIFDELLSGRLMSDPSVLVTNPTRSDPSLAPDGRHIYYVLFPTPNLDAPIDWARIAPALPRARPRHPRAARLGGFRRRDRGRARDDPGRLGGPRDGARRAVRGGPLVPARPGRSGRATCGARTSSSRVRARSRASASRWCWSPAGWPPSASSAGTAPTAPAPGGDDHRPTRVWRGRYRRPARVREDGPP